MNTAGSVAYGWGVLCVAAGVSFYFAKKEIDGRRRDQQSRGSRPNEQLSWQQRVARDEANAKRTGAAPGRTSVPDSSSPGMTHTMGQSARATGVGPVDGKTVVQDQ